MMVMSTVIERRGKWKPRRKIKSSVSATAESELSAIHP